MIKTKHFAAMAVLLTGASLPVLGEEQKPASSQEQKAANPQERYKPPLNLIMVATQLRHFKLWYAGIVNNWPLANYELTQIRESIDDAINLYPNTNMRMMAPALNELEDAIKAKDGAKFSAAYTKLTALCNSCHEATGFGFIKIRDPRLSPLETSPFSDESFSGK
jgi:cytochrome c553